MAILHSCRCLCLLKNSGCPIPVILFYRIIAHLCDESRPKFEVGLFVKKIFVKLWSNSNIVQFDAVISARSKNQWLHHPTAQRNHFTHFHYQWAQYHFPKGKSSFKFVSIYFIAIYLEVWGILKGKRFFSASVYWIALRGASQTTWNPFHHYLYWHCEWKWKYLLSKAEEIKM